MKGSAVFDLVILEREAALLDLQDCQGASKGLAGREAHARRDAGLATIVRSCATDLLSAAARLSAAAARVVLPSRLGHAREQWRARAAGPRRDAASGGRPTTGSRPSMRRAPARPRFDNDSAARRGADEY